MRQGRMARWSMFNSIYLYNNGHLKNSNYVNQRLTEHPHAHQRSNVQLCNMNVGAIFYWVLRPLNGEAELFEAFKPHQASAGLQVEVKLAKVSVQCISR